MQHVIVDAGQCNLCNVQRAERIHHAKGITRVEESKNFLNFMVLHGLFTERGKIVVVNDQVWCVESLFCYHFIKIGLFPLYSNCREDGSFEDRNSLSDSELLSVFS